MIDPRELRALSPLLDAALDLPDDAARARWLEALAPEHLALKAHLEKMLAGGTTLSPMLDRGAPIAALLDADAAPAGLVPGQLIGPWRLVRELGRGGMSIVWLAERAERPDAAAVALKLPAVSLDGPAFLARFARERSFLEHLDHPGIVRLVEAGVSESGQHYLALEYVDGVPLTVYCDERELGVDDRLAVFDQVLGAVAFAHARSILHRDLKPSNVLVTRSGAVHLLDFGIAKLLVDGAAEETELTAHWGRALTRDYASPEQIEGGTVTARSDVFSLGVVLHELLCGRRPDRGATVDAVDASGPPALASESVRPDAVVARVEGGGRALSRRLAGDLDAILAKALRTSPSERYADVAAMAGDLSQVRARRPLRSRLAHWRFGVGRGLRRHAAGGAVAALLLLAIGGTGSAHRLAAALEAAFAAEVPEELRAVLVSIGSEDHRRVFGGQSPLDPVLLQRLVARILDGRPAVLAIDLDTSAPPFAVLRRAFDDASMRRIVWGRDLAAVEAGASAPVPRPVLGGEPGEPASLRTALAVSVLDGATGTVRWWRRSVPTVQGPLPSLAAEILRDVPPRSLAGNVEDDAALRNIAFARSDRLDLPASVVLAEGFDWGERLRDRVVLLGGRYDPADVHTTALGPTSGLEIVAHTVETERTGRAYRRPSPFALLLIGLVDWALLIMLLDRLRLRLALPLGLVLGGLLALLLAASGAFAAWPYAAMAAVAVVAAELVGRGLRRPSASLARLRGWLGRRARTGPLG